MNETHAPKKLSDMPLTCTSCQVCPTQGCDIRSRGYRPDLAAIGRRAFVAGSAGTMALAGLGTTARAQSTTATADAESSALKCVPLTAEQTEGPYYVDDLLLRDDISEAREGVALDLEISVIDAVTCAPLADAAVDIWHCDALGDYSGVGGQMGNDDTSGQTWMRGVQLTDASGVARMRTVYPGWYVGRCTHIHLKVHIGGTAEDGTYLGGTTAHTGQLYFDDAMSDDVAKLSPYNTRLDIVRTRNDEDGVLRGALNEPGFLIEVMPISDDDLAQGLTGKVTLGINPSAQGS